MTLKASKKRRGGNEVFPKIYAPIIFKLCSQLIASLIFEEYVETLKIYLQKYMELEGVKNSMGK